MKHFVLLIITYCQISNVLGVLEWTVVGKVTDYGQNVTLFCNVSNCCPKHAGWDKWTPSQHTLYIDVKTGRSNKKYDGKTMKDGYTLIIQNLTKEDLNVSYSCLYDVTLGEIKYLLERDVFKYISTIQPIDSKGFSGGKTTGIILGVVLSVAVIVFIIIIFWKRRKQTRRNITCNPEGSNEELPLINTQRKKRVDERNPYMTAITSGEEVRQYVRIQVIGKDHVGKTSLVHRLLFLDEGNYKGSSTDGIDINRKCQIKTSNGDWIVGEVEREKEMIKRILQAVKMKQKRKIPVSDLPISSEHEEKQLDTEQNQNGQELIPPKEHGEIQNFTSETQYTDNASQASHHYSEEHKVNIDTKEKSNDNDLKHPKELFDASTIPAEKPILFSENIDQITDMIVEKMYDIILNAKIEKDNMISEGLVECGIWDFAGKKDYYATHQTFFTPHAIYLLVADVNEDIKAIKHEEEFNFDSIGDYIDFWFDSIHCFCKDISAEKLCPAVIMVCTGTDKLDKDVDWKSKYNDNYCKLFGSQTKADHRRGIYFISNTEFLEEDNKEIKRLRKHISEIAKEMNYFGEKLPTRWIQLEYALGHLKGLEENNVCSFENMERIAYEYSIKEEELLRFLNYQHNIGNIIFFKDIKEYIILQPEWLVKCFRCLVCDCHDEKRNFNLICSSAWNKLQSTGELSNILINQLFQKEPTLKFGDHQAHLLKVMEKFDIVVKPRFRDAINNTCQLSDSFYLPCMIEKTTLYESIKNAFIGNNSEVAITPWLVLEFEFLPLAYFNHILFHYIRNNEACKVHSTESEHPAIYKGKAVFELEGMKKLIICFSHNAISVQIWEWDDKKDYIYKKILNTLCETIHYITDKLNQKISYSIKAKCSKGDYTKIAGRVSFQNIAKCDKYFCNEHTNTHEKKDIWNTWLKYAHHEHEREEKIPSAEATLECSGMTAASVFHDDNDVHHGRNRILPKEWPPSKEDQENMVKDSVIRITDLKNPLFLQMYTDPNVYKIRNKTRGKVFLLNNDTFSMLSFRHSESDNSNLRKLFKELHFDVIQKDNLTGQGMLKFLKEKRDEVDWNTMDCVILLLSSHGSNNGIIGTDGFVVEVEKFTEIFDSSNCPGLDKKPRLVFVQACRTLDIVEEKNEKEGVLTMSQGSSQSDIAYIKEHNLKEEQIAIDHTAADFLIAYSTPAGNASFINIRVGSWFLNAVVWIFKYNAHEEEIQHMFLRVNQLVSQGRTMSGRCTVSEIKNNLRKKFLFFPGVHDYPPKFIDR